MKSRKLTGRLSNVFVALVAGMLFNFNPMKKLDRAAKEWKPEFTSSELNHVRWLRANVSKKASEQEVKRLRNVYLEARSI